MQSCVESCFLSHSARHKTNRCLEILHKNCPLELTLITLDYKSGKYNVLQDWVDLKLSVYRESMQYLDRYYIRTII